MKPVTSSILLAAIAAMPLAGCSSAPPVYVEAKRSIEAPPPIIKEVQVPVAIPQWRRLPDTRPATTQASGVEILSSAVRSATRKPSDGEFIAAVQTYDYVPGMVYQVIASPGYVTTILLEPGEELVSKVAGDTAQWLVGDSHSGGSDDARTLVVIKPLKSDLQTNLVLATNRRIYQLDLRSMTGVYHSAVQWTYPVDFARQLQDAEHEHDQINQTVIDPRLDLSNLDFEYHVKAKGDRPDWMPLRVFTDGHKTYIAFPKDIDATDAPPLFVLSPKGDAQLVNYRQKGNYYIVDQVIDKAELRLGESPQQIVRIERATW